jgi:uncharacterized protein (TIGR02246 family)
MNHSIALALAVSLCCAGAALAGDDDDVKAAVADMDAAWGKGDSKAIVALHTDDCLVLNPAGMGAKGRTGLEALLGKLNLAANKGAAPKTTVLSIRHPAKDVAVVDADVAGDGPDGKPVVAKRVSVMVKQGGKWLVSDSRAFFLLQPVGGPATAAKDAPKKKKAASSSKDAPKPAAKDAPRIPSKAAAKK